ncbi:hypothetical protein ACFWGT_03150 [Nocardiopsis sp. NPDC060348]
MVGTAAEQLRHRGTPPGGVVRVRSRFVWTEPRHDAALSDRRLPERARRPSATRILTPRGVALRLYLIALYEAQARGTAVDRVPVNDMPLCGAGRETGWTDLIAVPVQHQARGRVVQSVTDKKLRALQSALAHLASTEVQLVHLPYGGARAGRFEGFQLLHESGAQEGPHALAYTVPRRDEPCVLLPAEMFTRGWIHLLEDSEIVFLMMLLHERRRAGHSDWVKVESEVRLSGYGVGRDSYAAHRALDLFGLVSVSVSPDRDENGRSKDFDRFHLPPLHQFRVNGEAFEQAAVEVVSKALTQGVQG